MNFGPHGGDVRNGCWGYFTFWTVMFRWCRDLIAFVRVWQSMSANA